MTEPARLVAFEDRLAEMVAQLLRQTGCTKRSAVRHALIDAIYSGALKPGDTLPPERRLVEALGVSLGTVQAALGELRQSGRIVRRRGDGSRVADGNDLSSNTWHFRLLDRRTRKPVFWGRAEVTVGEVAVPALVAEFLGEPGPFVRVRRQIKMLGGLPVGADMYLRAETARPLLRMNPTDLALISLRAVLSERFGIVATRVATLVSTAVLCDVDAAAFGLNPSAPTFHIEARVYGGDDAPLYFQRVLAACDDFILSF